MFKDPILKPKLVMKDVGFVKCGSEFIVIQKSKKKKKKKKKSSVIYLLQLLFLR